MFSKNNAFELDESEELKPLPIYEIEGEDPDSDLTQHEWSTNGSVILSLFHERGLWSGHGYQPKANHRDVDHNSWNSVHKDTDAKGSGQLRPPLRDTFVKPSAEHKLDLITPISLFAYALEPENIADGGVDEEDLCNTLCDLNYDTPEGETKTSRGHLLNMKSVIVSAVHFKRALRLFGYKCVDDKGKELGDRARVQVKHLYSFFRLFDGHDISTEEKFRKFLDDFGLLKLFKYDDTVDWETNVSDLGFLVRSLQPIRVCSYEGQHRWLLLVLFCCGYYKCDNHVPLEKVSFVSSFPDCDWSSMQTFQRMKFRIGGPKSAQTTVKDALHAMFKFSALVTRAQTLNLNTSFSGTVSNMCRYIMGYLGSKSAGNLLSSPAVAVAKSDVSNDPKTPAKTPNKTQASKSSKKKPPKKNAGRRSKTPDKAVDIGEYYAKLDFDNLWHRNNSDVARPQWSINCDFVLKGFLRYMMENNSVFEDLFDGERKKADITKINPAINKSWSEKTYFPALPGNLKDPLIPEQAAYVLELIRVGITNPENLQTVSMFMNQVPPKIKQEEDLTKFKSQFCTYAWIRHYIMLPHFSAQQAFREKTRFEQSLIVHVVRKEIDLDCHRTNLAIQKKKDDVWEPYTLEKRRTESEHCINILAPKTKSGKKSAKHLTLAELGIKSVEVMNKFFVTCNQYLLLDIMKAILKYGYNPHVPEIGNKMLRLYIE